ncbi:hypothetical protein MPTK1_2g17350 [Marchantia polymorpha subsp. ruderalis]|uniref:Uncharacterized protein n=1 Tax=Marchantia polymorpha TaxID=3197 RepID=A0A2R6WG53_MARPO|nr:hypothetical protein MARPO_0094s0003 [Marchantia polymorpha]BBN02698.1 hypothetical protein Mp_2g17350 [Marchantia polymorpha subsp. ruderalis]|eukprot:PTQ32821.1 hypothetical protein MARPO_0094s0003 [Marchantia polymorpha]
MILFPKICSPASSVSKSHSKFWDFKTANEDDKRLFCGVLCEYQTFSHVCIDCPILSPVEFPIVSRIPPDLCNIMHLQKVNKLRAGSSYMFERHELQMLYQHRMSVF